VLPVDGSLFDDMFRQFLRSRLHTDAERMLDAVAGSLLSLWRLLSDESLGVLVLSAPSHSTTRRDLDGKLHSDAAAMHLVVSRSMLRLQELIDESFEMPEW
jgi:hypothetical protein